MAVIVRRVENVWLRSVDHVQVAGTEANGTANPIIGLERP
jgi:hypothetical protein